MSKIRQATASTTPVLIIKSSVRGDITPMFNNSPARSIDQSNDVVLNWLDTAKKLLVMLSAHYLRQVFVQRSEIMASYRNRHPPGGCRCLDRYLDFRLVRQKASYHFDD